MASSAGASGMMDSLDRLIERLGKLDSCALSDALDSLGLAGEVSGIRRLATGKRIAGRVVTVKLAAGKPSGQPPRHLCTAAIEAAGPGDVIVVEQRTGIDAAGWGGVLSNAARAKGVAGVIVEGPARDIDESMELDFPVYARMATARTARGRIYERDFDCEITVGEVTVRSGDLVVADSSAIVFVAPGRVDEVLRTAERIAAREALMTRAVLDGAPVSEVMGSDYEKMLDSV